jgi:hypothetical protein
MRTKRLNEQDVGETIDDNCFARRAASGFGRK